MAERGTETKNMMRNMFRRSSSTEHGESKFMLVDVEEMPTILRRVGQKVNEEKLMHYINTKIDIEHTGRLDYDNFTKVCEKFLTDPAMIAKVKGDDFSFKHMLTPDDFITP